jgi:hypothetical protein
MRIVLLVLTPFCLCFYKFLVYFVLTVCYFFPFFFQSIPTIFQLYLGARFYLVEENGIPKETTDLSPSHNVVSSTPSQSWNSNS